MSLLLSVPSVPAHQPDDDSLNLHILFSGEDRLHLLVRGLEAYLPVGLTEEPLQRRLALNQCRHHLTVLGVLATMDDDEVAVMNSVVDHRASVHTKDEVLPLLRERFGNGNDLVARQHLDGTACRDPPVQRNLDRSRNSGFIGHDERTALVPSPDQNPLLHEESDVLLKCSERGVTESLADFSLSGRDSPVVAIAPDEIDDFLLPLGQCDLRP